MVVTDGHLFPPSDMKVRITSWDGRDTVVDLQREWSVDKVKIVAMEHFLRPGDSMKTSLYHKLLHVRLSKSLTEELTLAQEGVKENDELLLLKRRLPPSAFETSDRQKEDRRTPDMATIRKVTSHLPKNSYPTKDEEPINSVDFQTELRRILISLIEASQRILCLNPSAAKIFKQAEEMLSEPLPQPKIDQSALRQLTDMGFPEPRAKKALILNKMAVMAAMDWLFQNENDPDIDTPLPELQEPSTSESPDGAEGQETPSSSEGRQSGEVPHYTNILDTIRAFKKREFRPNPRALQRLVEMGFAETESVEALRMFRNDQDAACDWLLGERRERGVVVEEGLDPSSLVYKAIMDNPTVQLGLNNPRCLLAFLQMLENPLAANQWLNDPETGPILMQVSRIYQMRLDGDHHYHRSNNSPPLVHTTTTTLSTGEDHSSSLSPVTSATTAATTTASNSISSSLPLTTTATFPLPPPSSVPPASTSLPPSSSSSSSSSSPSSTTRGNVSSASSRRVTNSTTISSPTSPSSSSTSSPPSSVPRASNRSGSS